MAIQIQLRQGTTAEHNTFKGASGEVTVDTTKKTLVVHDGTTVGGTALAKVSELPSLVPQATEAVAGKAKIATTAIAQAGVNDTDFITAKKLREALNATGEAPISAIRSYVIGSATSAPTILRSMNVASVTKPASSQLTVNFIKPMTDTNYIVLAYAKYNTSPDEHIGGVALTKTVNSCTINFRVPSNQSNNAPEYSVVIL